MYRRELTFCSMNKHSQEHLKTSKLGEDPLTSVTFNLKVFHSGLKLQFPGFHSRPCHFGAAARSSSFTSAAGKTGRSGRGSWSSSEARAAIPTSGRDATRSHQVPPGPTGSQPTSLKSLLDALEPPFDRQGFERK